MKKKATDFVTNCVLPPRPFDLIWWQKLIWTSVFALMLLVATGGNIIVMWIVLGKFTCTFFSYNNNNNNNVSRVFVKRGRLIIMFFFSYLHT